MRAVLALIIGVLVAATACTPEQFQRWWVEQGNTPLAEPELSQRAEAATRYWDEVARRGRFAALAVPIDTATARRMTPSSWRPGCPVGLGELRYLQVTHMTFDGRETIGELVVHADAVGTVVAALEVAWQHRYPIESMRLVDEFGGSDAASMAANNTSAFNCRTVAGTSRWSEHAYGRAIDINPVQNPWVSGASVEPPAGRSYAARDLAQPGVLGHDSPIVAAFRFFGWGWGGTWSSAKDYMHLSASGR